MKYHNKIHKIYNINPNYVLSVTKRTFFLLHFEGDFQETFRISTHSIVEKMRKNQIFKTFLRNRNLDIYFCPFLKSQNTFGFFEILLTIF